MANLLVVYDSPAKLVLTFLEAGYSAASICCAHYVFLAVQSIIFNLFLDFKTVLKKNYILYFKLFF